MLARDDRQVIVIETAFATQGLAAYVDGSLTADATALALGEATIAEATREVAVDAPGRLELIPARAPFEQLARAKTIEASQRLAARVETAADRADHVILDVPPVAANPHVAAVTTADRRVAVTRGTERGAEAHRLLVDRLADLDCPTDATVAVGGSIPAADATVELPGDRRPAERDDEAAGRLAPAVESALGVELSVEFETAGPLSRMRETVRSP